MIHYFVAFEYLLPWYLRVTNIPKVWTNPKVQDLQPADVFLSTALATAQKNWGFPTYNYGYSALQKNSFFGHLCSKIGSIQVEVKYLKSAAKNLIFWLQIDMNQIF